MNSRYLAPNTPGILWITVEETIDDLTPNRLNPSEHHRIIAHHTTLVYGKTLDELPPQLRQMIGGPFPLYITGSAANAELGIQAYTVNVPEELKQLSGKTHPHITHFQAIRDGQPVSATLSNDMLASGDYTFVPLNHTVPATIRFCPIEHELDGTDPILRQEHEDRLANATKRLAQALSEPPIR